jgi:choline-sulfatase
MTARRGCLTACTPRSDVADDRPNILLIMADQLSAGALPAYGHPVVSAPNLTRLAEAGAVFEAAYCASPLCAPSRSAMLTGRRASAVGVYDNAAELPAGTPTITHLLRAAGYATVLTGKMHFVGPDQLHGFEQRLTSDVYPATFDWTPDWRLSDERSLPWYHNMNSLLGTRIAEAAMQTDYDDEVCFTAVQLLRDLSRQPHRRPFFATVSFTNPHDPWEVRRPHWERYSDSEIGLPEVATIPREQADPHSLRLRDMIGCDERPLSEEEVRKARHGYYAAISYLDDRVGDVLDALEATGLANDTIVLFTADHGEMLGERGLWYKMSFFDGSARVPLIAAGPGIAPARHAGPVSQVDLAPTLAELAAVGGDDAEYEGTSLAPLLRGGAAGGPDWVAGEYLAEGVRAPSVMLRRGRHKFIRTPGDPDQLYDLDADRLELDNLAGDPAHAAVVEEMGAEVRRRWDLEALDAEVRESQRRRRLVAAGLRHGAQTPWDHQPFVDASVQWVRGERAGAEHPSRLRPRGDLPERE